MIHADDRETRGGKAKSKSRRRKAELTPPDRDPIGSHDERNRGAAAHSDVLLAAKIAAFNRRSRTCLHGGWRWSREQKP
jgi:hypothetical protein